jgi:hypothetical protein
MCIVAQAIHAGYAEHQSAQPNWRAVTSSGARPARPDLEDVTGFSSDE